MKYNQKKKKKEKKNNTISNFERLTVSNQDD